MLRGKAIRILHDPHGVVRNLCDRPRGMSVRAAPKTVNHNINQALARAHELRRRLERGQRADAPSLLDRLRHTIASAASMTTNVR